MEDTDSRTKESSISRHTEDMQEIITKVPGWILKWGVMNVFGILLIVVVISIFVRYPDTIKAGLKIESAEISTPVSPNVNSKITRLFIKQGATVKRGQPLVELESLKEPNEICTLNAPQTGRANFVGIVQPGIFLKQQQIVFNIHPENEQFFGIIQIPSSAINKIRINQGVLINLNNYSADEYGQLTGIITYIADEPNKSDLFLVKVKLNNSTLKHPIPFKDWMTGEAKIITQNVSFLKHLTSGLF